MKFDKDFGFFGYDMMTRISYQVVGFVSVLTIIVQSYRRVFFQCHLIKKSNQFLWDINLIFLLRSYLYITWSHIIWSDLINSYVVEITWLIGYFCRVFIRYLGSFPLAPPPWNHSPPLLYNNHVFFGGGGIGYLTTRGYNGKDPIFIPGCTWSESWVDYNPDLSLWAFQRWTSTIQV